MTFKEFGDRVEFRLRSVADVDELKGFHKKYQALIRIDGKITLRVRIDDEPQDIHFNVSNGLVQHEDGPLQVLRAVATLENEGLAPWLGAAAVELTRGAGIDGTLEASKLHNPDEGDFILFNADAIASLASTIRTQILVRPLQRLTIRTPLTRKSHVGTAALVIPLDKKADMTPVAGGRLTVPCTEIPALDGLLAGIQLDNLFAGSNAVRELPRWDCKCSTARALAEWALAAPLRLSVARTLLEVSSTVTDDQVAKLLERAKQDEDDLIRGRLKELREAREVFRSDVLDLLGDLQKLRAEVGSLMGADLFHNLVAIAIAISGLELADAPRDVTMGIALGVGILFLVAGTIKAEVNRREFNRVVRFAQNVSTLPASAAVPDFRTWFQDFHNKAVTEFHVLYLGGTMAAALPAITVGSYWAWIHAVWGAPWAVTAVLAGAAAASAIFFLARKPCKRLQIPGATPGASK